MIDRVVAILRDVAQEIVVPRFRNLKDGEVMEKGPGDLVTVADRESEIALAARLAALLPGSIVVGEEAVAADPLVLAGVGEAGPVWLVDPIDGTSNFAAGREPFALMVALLRGGQPVLCAIYEPMAGTVSVAEAGSGSFIDGVRMTMDHRPAELADLRGAVLSRYLPVAVKERVAAGLPRIGTVLPGQHCAGREYPDVVRGRQDFAMFWRSLPWDHAPGALLVREAGGVVRHFDGSEYDPTKPHPGLLVCRDDEVFQLVRKTLLE